MKRTLALLIVLAMLSTMLAVFVSADEEPTVYNLLPASGDWTQVPNKDNSVNVTYLEKGIQFAGEMKTSEDTWPSVEYSYETPITVKAEDYYLVFDFTVTGEGDRPRGAVCFYCDNNTNVAYHLGNLATFKLFGVEEPNTDDFEVGNYKGAIKLSDFAEEIDFDWKHALKEAFNENGEVKFTTILVFACGGGTITINELSLVPVSTYEKPVLWKETESIGEDGIYSYTSALDYNFRIDSVNVSIAAEKSTIVTDKDRFTSLNPNWAISVELKPTAEANKYEVVGSPVAGSGPDTAGWSNFTWAEGNVVMVIHSSGSLPENEKGTYPNYEQKVVALALKEGDVIEFTGVDFSVDGALDPAGNAHVVVPGAKATIKEEITVDGDLNDTGWDPEKWIEVTEDNGAIQGKPDGKPFRTYKLQLRTDDTKVYVAAVIDAPMTVPADDKENEAPRNYSTNFRLWIQSDSSYDRYTHFFDVIPDKDGNTVLVARYNTVKDGNTSALTENTSLSGVIKEADGKTVVEMSFDIAEVLPEGSTELRFFANILDRFEKEGGAKDTVGVFYPGIAFEEGDPNMPWTKWYAEGEGKLNLASALLGEREEGGDEPEPQGPTYEDLVKEEMGQASEDAKFALELSADKEEYKAGDKITVTVKAKDITVTDGLTIVKFNLTYDDEKLEFVVDNEKDFDKQGALLLNAKAPGEDSWESLSSIKDNGVIEISYGTSDPDAAAKADGELEFTFEFTVKADAKGDVGVWVPHESVVGYDSDVSRVKGNGDYVVVAEKVDAPIVNPDDPKPPKPGDVSVSLVVLAIVALVAVAGSAVVIKTRR